MRKNTALLFFIFAIAGAVFASSALDPSKQIYDARNIGLGGVSSGFSCDGASIFLNPAGIGDSLFPQITAGSRKIALDETQYSLVSTAFPTNYGIFGIGFVGFTSGNSLPTVRDPNTNRIIQNPSLEVGNNSNTVVALSYSRKFKAPPIAFIKTPFDLLVGGNLKFFNQALSAGGASENGTGTGIDLSAEFKPYPWASANLFLQNFIGGSIKWKNSEDTLGKIYKIGGIAHIWGGTDEALSYSPQKLSAGIDIALPNEVLSLSNSPLYHLGIEYSPYKNLALRGGINQEAAGAGLTLGLGFTNGGFRFDYAYYARPGLPGDNPHYFSLSYVGDRIMSTEYALKNKIATLKLLSPRNRLITTAETVALSLECWAEKQIDVKKTWSVTAFGSTHETHVKTQLEKVDRLFINGKELDKYGTFEVTEKLGRGRNVFHIDAQSFPETIAANQTIPAAATSLEVKVLRVAPFHDVDLNFWAAEPIYLNVSLGLVTGYPDNHFKPDAGITRAELVALLVRSLNIPSAALESYGTFETYGDVNQAAWSAKFINYGGAAGYITGYRDGTFAPNKILNRAEGITILARYARLTEEAAAIASSTIEASAEASAAAPPYHDLKPEYWANQNIRLAKKNGLLKYLEGKDFKPAAKFTRAEACEVLYNIAAIQKKVDEFWDYGITLKKQ